MILKYKISLVVVMAMLTISACKKEPQLVPMNAKSNGTESSAGAGYNESLSEELHTVVVKEILPTSKYVYLNVEEGPENFWIAVIKQDIKIGETYYYKRALLKTNFESKEHNKVFDKIYLVTNLVSSVHGDDATQEMSNVNTDNIDANKGSQASIKRNIEQKGSIKIAELVKDPKKYEGKTVQISGECVKVNAGIMDRNWIHLKDGSKDDFDLVVTTDVIVPIGKVVTMKALVTLNKDFGAGYIYDLILENGIIIP
jgi:hypothetical protein